MVNRPYPPTLNYPSYEVDSRLTEGVISRRFWAYLIDLVVIALWVVSDLHRHLLPRASSRSASAGALFFALPLTALIFIVYNAVTIGGASQATVGMRYMGLRVDRPTDRPGPLAARGRRACAVLLRGDLDLPALGLRRAGRLRPRRPALHPRPAHGDDGGAGLEAVSNMALVSLRPCGEAMIRVAGRKVRTLRFL